MSRLAQAVQRAVDDLRHGAVASRPGRRRGMDDMEIEPDTAVVAESVSDLGGVGMAGASPPSEGGSVVLKTRKAKKKARKEPSRRAMRARRRSTKARVVKAAKHVRAVKSTKTEPRVLKTYELCGDVPESIRNPSAGRSILEAIKARGRATREEIAADLGPKFSQSTLRFFLGKFQRDNTIGTRQYHRNPAI